MLTVDYDRLGVGPGHRVLDLGCGAGRHAFGALARGADVVAFDLDQAALKDANALMAAMLDTGDVEGDAAGQAVNGSALDLPFPDASFDHVIASEVLEHVPDDRRALAELARVLRPGGTLGATVPRWGPELVCWALSDEYHLTPGGHVRIYRESALRDRVRDTGLEPYGKGYAHGLHSPYWWLKCAVGVKHDDHPLVSAYHRLLVWDITDRPLATRAASAVLDPVLGKSLVLYARKPS